MAKPACASWPARPRPVPPRGPQPVPTRSYQPRSRPARGDLRPVPRRRGLGTPLPLPPEVSRTRPQKPDSPIPDLWSVGVVALLGTWPDPTLFPFPPDPRPGPPSVLAHYSTTTTTTWTHDPWGCWDGGPARAEKKKRKKNSGGLPPAARGGGGGGGTLERNLTWGVCVQNHSTQDSHVVPHHGTNWAALRLTAQIGRDAVLSESYGRGYCSYCPAAKSPNPRRPAPQTHRARCPQGSAPPSRACPKAKSEQKKREEESNRKVEQIFRTRA